MFSDVENRWRFKGLAKLCLFDSALDLVIVLQIHITCVYALQKIILFNEVARGKL